LDTLGLGSRSWTGSAPVVLLSVRTIPADRIHSHDERVDPDEQQDRECGPMR
jgi:hypothetical protein